VLNAISWVCLLLHRDESPQIVVSIGQTSTEAC